MARCVTLRPLSLLTVAYSIAVQAQEASAPEETVAVLGIESFEWDDALAEELTIALEHAARQAPVWRVSSQRATFSQLAIEHDCTDERDLACLARIAATLKADWLLFGSTRRTTHGPNYNYGLTLHLFNASAGTIRSFVDRVSRSETDMASLHAQLLRYVNRFPRSEQTGSLRVLVYVPNVMVSIDGRRAGIAKTPGTFVLSKISAGPHRVDLMRGSNLIFHGVAIVQADDEAVLDTKAPSSRRLPWSGQGVWSTPRPARRPASH